MKRLSTYLATLTLAAVATAPLAFGEVYAELGPDGSFVGTHIVVDRGNHTDRVWRPTGLAPASSLVLNPDGDVRGDGRPDIAVSPVTHLPRAVWAQRNSSGYDIATSQFNGYIWSAPVLVHLGNHVNDVDPRITFRADGVAIVTWWVKGISPTVRMAYATPDGAWHDAGVISAAGTKAKRPEIRQEGSLTIIAYRTPENIGIVTLNIVIPTFADGPTPFPRSGDGPLPTHEE
jgi:hypothetical protein